MTRAPATQESLAVRTENVDHVGESRGYSVHGLEKHQRTRLRRTGLQPFATCDGFCWRKSFETETIGRQP